MPALDWIGKEAVFDYHRKVPFHFIETADSGTVGTVDHGNLLIHGDNLIALKSLLPYYRGCVKCIYIDPPYNTGKESWIYNDNVNSPELRSWLGKVVGREAEDLTRHDKWLCMMYPRLALAKEFLSDDGVIFISIDDNELPHLRLIMDEIFLPKNLLACFVWQTNGNFDNQAKVKIAHEYVLAYTRNAAAFPPPPIIDPNTPETSKLFLRAIRNTIVKNGPKNPVSDLFLPTGFPADFEQGIIPARDTSWPHYATQVEVENFALKTPVIAISGWSSKTICEKFIATNFTPVIDSKGQPTRFTLTRTGAIEGIKERSSSHSHVISVLRDVGTTQQASAMLARMDVKFDYPKPVGLIQYLISMVIGNAFVVLDFFAGSGTTGHAVLNLNKADGGQRQFILVESSSHIYSEVCAKRLTAVVRGYGYQTEQGVIETVEPAGYGFSCARIGKPLFDTGGRIYREVSFSELARYVYFTEALSPLPSAQEPQTPLLGVSNDIAIYLLYNGILKDKTPSGGNILTRQVLASLPVHHGPKIIYGSGCRLSEDRLRRENITFRQIPYQVRMV